MEWKEVGSTFADHAKGIAGNIAHATISFFPENNEPVQTNAGAAGNAGLNALANAAANTGLSGLAKRAASNAESALEKAAAHANNAAAAAGIRKQISQGNTFEVQFNPSSLKITARGGGRILVKNSLNPQNSESDFKYAAVDPHVDVSMTLIFDAVDQQDAFFADKFTFAPPSLVKGISAAAAAGKGKVYSVKPQVEGFIGALRTPEHRRIVFTWGHLVYEGVLNNVDAKYTMFNPMGNPIRAEVGLKMTCTGDESLKYWYQRYQEGMTEKDYVNNQNLSNYMGNLFQL